MAQGVVGEQVAGPRDNGHEGDPNPLVDRRRGQALAHGRREGQHGQGGDHREAHLVRG